jgi:hypothetical protein
MGYEKTLTSFLFNKKRAKYFEKKNKKYIKLTISIGQVADRFKLPLVSLQGREKLPPTRQMPPFC